MVARFIKELLYVNYVFLRPWDTRPVGRRSPMVTRSSSKPYIMLLSVRSNFYLKER